MSGHDHDPIDHRRLVASLAQAERDRLTERTDRDALARIVAHLGLIAMLGAAIGAGVPFWWALLVPQGILIVFLFTALHETSHETAFRSGRLNSAVAWLCGFLVAVPPVWFRYFHFAHHRHTHDPERDPELASPKPATRWQYAWHLTGLPLWWGMAKIIAGNAAARDIGNYVPPKGRERVIREAQLFLGLYAALAAASLAVGSAVLVWIWVVPALLGQPFLRAYLLAEHARCPHVANMLENTRTTFTNRIVRFVAWNMPFHAEHHAYPAVPFHRLPAFHAIAREHLRATADGYGRFHRDYAAALEG